MAAAAALVSMCRRSTESRLKDEISHNVFEEALLNTEALMWPCVIPSIHCRGLFYAFIRFHATM